MRRKKDDVLFVYSEEKIDEFKDMPLRARLQWLEEANMFVNKAVGIKRRALFDERFKGLREKKTR